MDGSANEADRRWRVWIDTGGTFTDGLAVAPDGSLFCTDWVKRDYKLHGHGRVWRISRKKKGERGGVSPPVTRKPGHVIDLSTITSEPSEKKLKLLLKK